MRRFYGCIDLDRLPPRWLIRTFEDQARAVYKLKQKVITKTKERFCMENVWCRIASWQERQAVEESSFAFGVNI